MERNNSLTRKLLAGACGAAVAAFVLGICTGRALKATQGRVYFSGMAFSGAILICVLLWTGRATRRFATSEEARKRARQFLASCVFFSMLTSTFGIFVSGLIWYSRDFIRIFGAAWFGLLTCVAIFPVHRDAKRLAGAGPSIPQHR